MALLDEIIKQLHQRLQPLQTNINLAHPAVQEALQPSLQSGWNDLGNGLGFTYGAGSGQDFSNPAPAMSAGVQHAAARRTGTAPKPRSTPKPKSTGRATNVVRRTTPVAKRVMPAATPAPIANNTFNQDDEARALAAAHRSAAPMPGLAEGLGAGMAGPELSHPGPAHKQIELKAARAIGHVIGQAANRVGVAMGANSARRGAEGAKKRRR